jgi:UDP-N-acetylglucosamine 2-epimerase (non-hydrolysing)
MIRVLTLFGTRPEIIKLAPVIRELEAQPERFATVNVASGQHTDLLRPFVELFGVRLDHDLRVMEPGQTPSGVCARVLTAVDPVLERTRPDLVLVQGDTTTALAGALAAFHRRIAVGHVEAGLRSGNPASPFPEEMNRRLITQLASLHFAATEHNRQTLLREQVPADRILLTGNPVVDAVLHIRASARLPERLARLIEATEGRRRILLTTHRRESLGSVMLENLRVLRRALDVRPDLCLIFPVHPNPGVVAAAREALDDHPRIHLVEPLGYAEFIGLLELCDLVVSDSGGVQEEAPSLGKPVLILRENTERPEAVDCGVARLVGGRPERLAAMLDEVLADGSWADHVRAVANPFGRGDAARRIAGAIIEWDRSLRGALAAVECS